MGKGSLAFSSELTFSLYRACFAGIEVISCVSHTLYNTEDICAKNGGRPPLSYKVSSSYKPLFQTRSDVHLSCQTTHQEVALELCFQDSSYNNTGTP